MAVSSQRSSRRSPLEPSSRLGPLRRWTSDPLTRATPLQRPPPILESFIPDGPEVAGRARRRSSEHRRSLVIRPDRPPVAGRARRGTRSSLDHVRDISGPDLNYRLRLVEIGRRPVSAWARSLSCSLAPRAREPVRATCADTSQRGLPFGGRTTGAASGGPPSSAPHHGHARSDRRGSGPLPDSEALDHRDAG